MAYIYAATVITRGFLPLSFSLSLYTVQLPVEGMAIPSMGSLVVSDQHSSWQCAYTLFSHLPLLKILFHFLTSACKKVRS